MPHAIYQTPALILKTKNMRESNKMVTLFTKKFGVMYASLQSVREQKSKMRFHVNLFSLVDVDVIDGRNIWKLVGIHEVSSSLTFSHTPWFGLFDKVSLLLLRLCQGQEPNDEIWSDIINLHKGYKIFSEEHSLEVIEIIFAARALYFLGYWEEPLEFMTIKNPYFDQDIQKLILENKSDIVHQINEGLHSSQL